MSEKTRNISILTGAGSGIGRATAVALAAPGATLWLLGRSADKLEATAAQVRSSGAQALCYAIDLGSTEQIRQLAGRVQDESGSLDVLVHSAGTIALGSVAEAKVEDFDLQYQINVRAVFLLTQTLLPALRAGRGQIVFMNSTAGRKSGGATIGQYAATKHALAAFADSLRDEVNPAGIRVLSLFIGRTATPMQAQVHGFEKKAYRPELLVQPEDVAAMVVAALRLPRTAEVTNISMRPMNKT